jgi:hypothetical protein
VTLKISSVTPIKHSSISGSGTMTPRNSSQLSTVRCQRKVSHAHKGNFSDQNQKSPHRLGDPAMKVIISQMEDRFLHSGNTSRLTRHLLPFMIFLPAFLRIIRIFLAGLRTDWTKRYVTLNNDDSLALLRCRDFNPMQFVRTISRTSSSGHTRGRLRLS